MEGSCHFDATNQLYDLAKQYNSDIDVLLSSWGPPSALKSNSSLSEGPVKQNENGEFASDAFVEYWDDSVNPNDLSIQNEPSSVTPDWEPSAWRPTGTRNDPGYQTSVEKVQEHLLDQSDPPSLIGPESANLGMNAFGNPFGTVAEILGK